MQLNAQTKLQYHTVDSLTLLGRPFPSQTLFKRFPDSLNALLRPAVWKLSKNSTGIAIYFQTNSTQISAKWKTGDSVSFGHVANTLVKGLDLYALDQQQWYYAGIGRPSNGKSHEATIIKELDGSMRSYLLYLPDYETTDSLSIGIDLNAQLQIPTNSVFENKKPIVFYGTSIVQGASAMRSGMAYPAIIERRLQRETINLGFSGNGQLDSMLAVVLSTIDAATYVIDCGPNLTAQQAADRTLPFLVQLKTLRPNTPILLVGHIEYPTARFNKGIANRIQGINQAFEQAVQKTNVLGLQAVYYLSPKGIIGVDGEATVDGVHLTDLGFFRIADALIKKLNVIIK